MKSPTARRIRIPSALQALAAVFASLVSFAFPAGAAEPARLLYDLAHGEAALTQPQQDSVKRTGLELVTVGAKGGLTSEALRGGRVLYLRAPTEAFTAEEKAAIVAFVRGGGSLLLVLDEERRQSLAKTGVNDLLAPFGMALTPDTEYLHNCGAIARAGEINRADREVPYSGGRAVEGGTPFAWQLDREGRPGLPFAASKRLPGGARLVVMGDGMASLLLGKPEGVRLSGVPRDPARTVFWGRDSALFMEEVLSWLAARP